MNLRVGVGYDLHRIDQARPLMLGCIQVRPNGGLAGHSDGDAVAHAVADALLGAAALDDIGVMFPPGDPRYAGISGQALLGRVRHLVAGQGWRIMNVDVTVIAEQPKLSPFREPMRTAIAAALGLAPAAVGIKAKTNEGMDSIGRGEAIAAHAVALIEQES